MNKISTISHRSKFEYTGSCKAGFYLEYSGRPFVPSELIKKALLHFGGQTVAGGFNVTNPSGFGAWLQNNSNLTSRHASHVAAVLVHEGKISHYLEGKSIYLQFPQVDSFLTI